MEQRQLVFILVVVTLLNFLALVAFEIFFSTENVIAVINGVWTKAAIFGSLAFTALIIYDHYSSDSNRVLDLQKEELNLVLSVTPHKRLWFKLKARLHVCVSVCVL